MGLEQEADPKPAATCKALRIFSAAFLILSAFGTSLRSQPAADQTSYSDERCPFAARFGPGMRPSVSRSGGVMTMTAAGRGFRISAACIPNPPGAGTTPLEGKALRDRLAMLAATLGVREAVIEAPAPPASSCGTVEGTITPGGVRTRVKTEFCYGPSAYLIVETTTDGSRQAED